MNREDVELYVTGNLDGDVAAFERAIAEDPALAEVVADEARFEMLLRDAVAAAQFCPACEELVRGERCDGCGAAVRPGGYTVERVLVSNAHGRMYLAHDADGKQVALKELAFVQQPSAATIDAFEREAKFLRALEHPAIPRFVASFEEGRGVHTRYYLAQELVRGKALDQLDEHWYTEAEIVDVARQVLTILVYLQSLSPMVIHRDIKPANLLRREDGTIALVDFGAAYVHGSTAGITTIGTFGYMPIEQLAGIVDSTTDGFALGSSLIYLLARQEPWRLAQSKTTLNVSAPLRAFIEKLTAVDPRDRFATAKDALVALDRRDELARRRAVSLRPRAWVRPALVAAVALTLGGGVVAGFRWRTSRIDAPTPSSVATVRISLQPNVDAELFLDGKKLQTVQNGAEIPISAGKHKLGLFGPGGARCEQELVLPAGKLTTIECAMPVPKPRDVTTPPPPWRAPPPAASFEVDAPIDVSFKAVSLHDALPSIGKSCGVSLVLPGHVDTKVSVQLQKVPCKDAMESLLEAHGLWYVYEPTANLLTIRPRREIDADREDRAGHPAPNEVRLPAGPRITLVKKQTSLREILTTLSNAGGLNLVMPDHIDAKLTIQFTDVPSNEALEAVLASEGLWYRFKSGGHIIRVAPRRELDAEDAR